MLPEEQKYGHYEQPAKTITSDEESEKWFKLLFDNLSIRAQYVLKNNNINSIDGLSPWIEGKTDSFLCDKRTSLELMEMVHKLRKHVESVHQPNDENNLEKAEATLPSELGPNIPIDSSEESEIWFKLLFDDLSVRAQNTLRNNKINSLEGLAPWIEGKTDNFLRFHNCGKQTSLELMEMVHKLRKYMDSAHQSNLGPNTPIDSIEESEIWFKLLFDDLSVRAQNTLRNNKINRLEGLAPWIEGKTDNFLCDKSTSLELMAMVNKLKVFVDFYQSRKENDLVAQEKECEQLVKKLIAINSSPPPLPVYHRVALKYTQLGYFPFFLALYLCLLLDDNKDFNIMIQCSNIYANESSKTISEISLENNLTQKRVREIRFKQFHRFRDRVVKISKGETIEDSKYNASSDYELRNITSREEVPFNSNFIVWVICLKNSQYKMIGNPSKAFFSSSSSDETLYAVPRVLSNYFDFKNFIESVKAHINEKRFYEERVELEQYVRNLCKDNYETTTFYEIIKVCRNIIERGFPDLIINSQLVFPANARKPILYLIEDILREFNRPMTAEEICGQLNDRYPDLEQVPSKIGAKALRNSNIVAISRRSTYTLAEWNYTEKRGGTIRDLAVEYLNSLFQPIAPLTDICDYIAKFREDVKESSVKANLLAKSNYKFSLFFKDGIQFIGLTEGKIDDSFIKQEKNQGRRSFSNSITLLEKFIKDNRRFPNTSSVDEDEARLSRFFRLSLTYLKDGKLSKEEALEIERITDTYGHLKVKKERVSWDEWLERFAKYITENNCLPHRSSPEYAWYEENKALFDADQLTKEQTSSFAFLNKIVARMS